MSETARSARAASVDDAEMAKFARMAAEWWDPNGKFAPLHKFNPVRLQFIRNLGVERFRRDARALKPFEGLTLLDIGCGGGLLSEPMSRLPTWPVMQTTGDESIMAVAMPVTRFVAPGPEVAIATPTPPPARA